MANKPILYNLDLSAPVRTVKIVAANIGVELEIRNVNLIEGEHLKEDYIKINPEHTVPTLDDNGQIIWDSHVIAAYLVDKYAKDDTLYPKDLFTRAKVNQRLFFEASALFPKIKTATVAIIFAKGGFPAQDKIDEFYKTFDILEAFLAVDPYLVGDHWTIADVSVANTVTIAQTYAPIDAEKYPKITAWLERIEKNIPHYAEINGTYVKQYGELIHAHIEKNKA